jgi:hypothetical protein
LHDGGQPPPQLLHLAHAQDSSQAVVAILVFYANKCRQCSRLVAGLGVNPRQSGRAMQFSSRRRRRRPAAAGDGCPHLLLLVAVWNGFKVVGMIAIPSTTQHRFQTRWARHRAACRVHK